MRFSLVSISLVALVSHASAWDQYGTCVRVMNGTSYQNIYMEKELQEQEGGSMAQGKSIYSFKAVEEPDYYAFAYAERPPTPPSIKGDYDATGKKQSYVCDLADVKASTNIHTQCACTESVRNFWDNEQACPYFFTSSVNVATAYCGVPACDTALARKFNSSQFTLKNIPAEREVQAGGTAIKDCICQNPAGFAAISTNYMIMLEGNTSDPLYAGAHANMAAFCANPSCAAMARFTWEQTRQQNFCLDQLTGENFTVYYETPLPGEALPETFTLTFVVTVNDATFDKEVYKINLAALLRVPVSQIVIQLSDSSSSSYGRRLAEQEVTAFVELPIQKANALKLNIELMDVKTLSAKLGATITAVKTISDQKGTVQETKGVGLDATGLAAGAAVAIAAGALVVAAMVLYACWKHRRHQKKATAPA